jgi:hypothetical protein
MRKARVCLGHPLLFVFDYSNRAFSVPEYDPGAPVSANETGLSVKAVSEVDGEVTVYLTDLVPPEVSARAHEVFAGSIPAPSKKLAVVTSENEKLLEAEVTSTAAQVRVLVDEPDLPSTIWVEAR